MVNWISLHLFYTDLNPLLKDAVRPLISNLRKQCLIEQYFFIRYREGGPHIRLRLLVKICNEEIVRQIATSFLNEYFNQNPSYRYKGDLPMYPNNSVQFIEYVPETERYGGKHALKIAEEHFQTSSETVLQLMEKYEEWNLATAQGKAIELYLVFFRSINLPKELIYRMLVLMNNSHWRSMAQNLVGTDNNIEEIFESTYKKNQHKIIAFIKNLDRVISTEIDAIPYLAYFSDKVKSMDHSLSILGRQDNILLRNYPKAGTDEKKSAIYISYLHMLNNRLGLQNHDEGYLSFILDKSLKGLL